MALADDYKAEVIKWKVKNIKAEEKNADLKIKDIRKLIDKAIEDSGAVYIQLPNSGDTVEAYRAVTGRQGLKKLEKQGFRVDVLHTHANIWWATEEEVAAEVEAILHPAPKPEPEAPIEEPVIEEPAIEEPKIEEPEPVTPEVVPEAPTAAPEPTAEPAEKPVKKPKS